MAISPQFPPAVETRSPGTLEIKHSKKGNLHVNHVFCLFSQNLAKPIFLRSIYLYFQSSPFDMTRRQDSPGIPYTKKIQAVNLWNLIVPTKAPLNNFLGLLKRARVAESMWQLANQNDGEMSIFQTEMQITYNRSMIGCFKWTQKHHQLVQLLIKKLSSVVAPHGNAIIYFRPLVKVKSFRPSVNMDWLLSVIDARACWLLRPSTYIWCDVQHRRTQDFDAWIKFKFCMQKPIDNQPPLSQKQPNKKNTTPWHASFPEIREKKEEPTLAILHLQRRYLALHPAQKKSPQASI